MKRLYKLTRQILPTLLFLLSAVIIAQEANVENRAIQNYRVMFYNLENLFDIYDDPDTHDDEFTPTGSRRWTNKKFYAKLNNIYKVVMAVGGYEPPTVVGMCEVENEFVLQRLLNNTPLKQFGYKFIHYDSPDSRGIDVAMIYRDDKFTPFHSEAIPVIFPDDPDSKTRDILYVKGLIGGREMIHIFINHWPSRYGGYMETKPKRGRAAEILKHKTDSLFNINPSAVIVIMGDFNDGPNDESLFKTLDAKNPENDIQTTALYNMMLVDRKGWEHGTLKYREYWDTFDQIIISGSLLDKTGNLWVDPNQEVIFHSDFLLQPDERYLGKKLIRTYLGFRYIGGYSDHLPVFFDLKMKME